MNSCLNIPCLNLVSTDSSKDFKNQKFILGYNKFEYILIINRNWIYDLDLEMNEYLENIKMQCCLACSAKCKRQVEGLTHARVNTHTHTHKLDLYKTGL